MACLLKAPDEGAKGIVSFTTQERDAVLAREPETAARLRRLKERWVVGLHHNWHDHSFVYDDVFDFSMAGEDDLVEVAGRRFPIVTLDACNFVPDDFRPGGEDKFWDVLYVARPVFFKGFGELLSCVRALYDSGRRYRILCICPMPPYDPAEAGSVFYDVRERYDEMFSEPEKDLFTLLTLDYRYPFPFDLPTLAHYYRSSRVFVHFAPDERRCRVAAYAWASGVPVVAMSATGSLLPASLRGRPYFYETHGYEEFPDLIAEALKGAGTTDFLPVREQVSARYTQDVLKQQAERLFPETRAATADDDRLALEGLDIRLGRHHGLASGLNAVRMPLAQFLATLEQDEELVREAIAEADDPEVVIAERMPASEDDSPRRGLRTLLAPRRRR
jgi:glycosyltransferase involved in cell wall biosynthesis